MDDESFNLTSDFPDLSSLDSGSIDLSGGLTGLTGYDSSVQQSQNAVSSSSASVQGSGQKQSYFGAFSAGVDKFFQSPSEFVQDIFSPTDVGNTAPTPVVENAVNALKNLNPTGPINTLTTLLYIGLGVAAIFGVAFLIHEVKV